MFCGILCLCDYTQLQQAQWTSLQQVVLLSDNCYNFEINSLDSTNPNLNYNKQSSHFLQKFHIFTAVLLKIESSGMWHWVSGSLIRTAKQSKCWIAGPCRWRNFHPSKCWELLTQQQGVTSYRTWMSFFLTAVMSQSMSHYTTNSSVATV